MYQMMVVQMVDAVYHGNAPVVAHFLAQYVGSVQHVQVKVKLQVKLHLIHLVPQVLKVEHHPQHLHLLEHLRKLQRILEHQHHHKLQPHPRLRRPRLR
jgi:hypothetical protein